MLLLTPTETRSLDNKQPAMRRVRGSHMQALRYAINDQVCPWRISHYAKISVKAARVSKRKHAVAHVSEEGFTLTRIHVHPHVRLRSRRSLGGPRTVWVLGVCQLSRCSNPRAQSWARSKCGATLPLATFRYRKWGAWACQTLESPNMPGELTQACSTACSHTQTFCTRAHIVMPALSPLSRTSA